MPVGHSEGINIFIPSANSIDMTFNILDRSPPSADNTT